MVKGIFRSNVRARHRPHDRRPPNPSRPDLDEHLIDIGGINVGATRKWRDAQRNPKVTFLVDDTPDRTVN